MSPVSPFPLRRTALLLVLACAAAACGGRAKAPPALSPLPQAFVVYEDDAGGLRDSVRLVVRSAAELDGLWRQATQGQDQPPPLPAVDWNREMVLAVAAGRMSPGDRIQVDSVGMRREPGDDGRMRDVLAVLVRTTQSCGGFTNPAFPVNVVRVRRYAGPVVFVERRDRAEGCAQRE
jgi:hypothetical protein